MTGEAALGLTAAEGAPLRLGTWLSPAWALPFAGMLLTLALAPLLIPRVWEHRRGQLLASLLWSAPVVGLLAWLGATHPTLGPEALEHLGHGVSEYASFVLLLGALYVISGGVALRGDLLATPAVNTGFLAAGAVLANLVGTTGASMLLIRPLLRTNSERTQVRHIPVFFIFVVSNIGGALTPIGDPPLFLGYLRGVPFWWTTTALWAPWLIAVGTLLVVFYVLDTWLVRQEPPGVAALDAARQEPLALEGGRNVLLLGGVIATVLLFSPRGAWAAAEAWHGREWALAALAGASWAITPRQVRRHNHYTWGPIAEVAALFLGVFVTMVPATLILQARGANLGLDQPWQLFWASGILSSFLDNAPTYVTFSSLACGAVAACQDASDLSGLAADPTGALLLRAIAAGSVFMGANSYIGNGPNFLVRALAEERGIRMPSFFGYMGWAAVVLLPIYALLTIVSFGGAG